MNPTLFHHHTTHCPIINPFIVTNSKPIFNIQSVIFNRQISKQSPMSRQSTESEQPSFSTSLSYNNSSFTSDSVFLTSQPSNTNIEHSFSFSQSSYADSSASEHIVFAPPFYRLQEVRAVFEEQRELNILGMLTRQYFHLNGLLIFATSLWGDLQSEQSSFHIEEEQQVGMRQEDIARLPMINSNEIISTSNLQAICVICHSCYQQNEQLRIFPCRHRFHRQCIDTWLKHKNTCPECRLTIQVCKTSI